MSSRLGRGGGADQPAIPEEIILQPSFGFLGAQEARPQILNESAPVPVSIQSPALEDMIVDRGHDPRMEIQTLGGERGAASGRSADEYDPVQYLRLVHSLALVTISTRFPEIFNAASSDRRS